MYHVKLRQILQYINGEEKKTHKKIYYNLCIGPGLHQIRQLTSYMIVLPSKLFLIGGGIMIYLFIKTCVNDTIYTSSICQGSRKRMEA